MPSSPYPMLAVPDALALVLDQAVPLPPESVPLTNALGRILAADVHATGPLPPFPASIKDGYAVVAADGPGIYPVVGAATAGHLPDFTLQSGQVAYITTGAPVPDGADAVVMVEETDPREDDRVHIRAAAKPGQDIRPVGVDVADGEVVLRKGDRLGPAGMGVGARRCVRPRGKTLGARGGSRSPRESATKLARASTPHTTAVPRPPWGTALPAARFAHDRRRSP